MLSIRNRITLTIPIRDWIDNILKIDGLRLVELSADILIESCLLPDFEYHKDLADRMIIATARSMNAYPLTFDQTILEYAKSGYVNVPNAYI